MIAGILLAAGASSRYAGDKLLQCLEDRTPIAVAAVHNMNTVLESVVAVVRPGNAQLAAQLTATGARVVYPRDAEQGMGNSLASGIAATNDADGWVIGLADMPFVRPDSVTAVALALRAGAPLAAPVYAGRRGHPVGFSGAFRNQLLNLKGEQGARRLVDLYRKEMVRLDLDDPGVLLDIDTPADLKRHQHRQ